MRYLKPAGIVLGALVALLAVVLLAVRFLVNPNDFKGRIASTVRESTGRELRLPGDIRLSVFPWVHLELGPASLGNPPGFDPRPFVSVEHVDLRVKLLPLLRKELRVGRIVIDGLDLRLLKNRDGVGNWQGLGGRNHPPESRQHAASTTEALQDLGGITLTNSRVSYQRLQVEGLNLDVGRIAAGVTTPVQMKLRLISAAGAAPTDLDGRFQLTPDVAADRYRMSALELHAVRGAQGGSGALDLKLVVPEADLDLEAQTVNAAAFSAEAGGAHVNGSLRGTRIVDQPVFDGSFRLEPCSPRALLKSLAVAAPPTRDSKAFATLAASGQFAYSSAATQLSGLQVKLDDSSLTGRVGLAAKDGGTIGFDLALDRIDFDRYRAPATPATATRTEGESHAAREHAAARQPDTLRLDGRLTAGELRVAGATLTRMTATVAARDGVLRIAPVTATLYGGTLGGDVTLDSRDTVPLLQVNQSLNAVDVAPLLRDLMGKPSRISGHGRVTTHLAARGSTAESIMRSLSGHVAANLDDGAVEGVDLWFEINRATELLQKGALSAGSGSGRTRFDAFSATADLRDGVATTRDLNVVSKNLRLAGQGTFDIVSENINYQIHAMVLRQPAAGAVSSANLVADIPANVTGTLTHPSIRPDLQGIARARVQQELDKHKDELKQKLQEQLQNLLR